jgi:hypothetical protein
MPVKKKPSAAQLAARAKFVKMVRAKAAAKKKAMPKKAAAKKLAGLDKVVRKGKKTSVYYSRVSGIQNIDVFLKRQIESDFADVVGKIVTIEKNYYLLTGYRGNDKKKKQQAESIKKYLKELKEQRTQLQKLLK